jgi:signal transduction histidine kinase
MGNTPARDDVRYVASVAVSQPATLSLVNNVATALRSGGASAGLAALEAEGIDASLANGTLTLATSVEPELEAALTTIFALARDDRELLPSGRHAALGELAAEIAHEINNPLFAILGLVELVRSDTEPGTKAHERLSLVERTGLEIKELVRTLLAFVREPTDEVRPVLLQQVVAETLELVRHTSASKDVAVVERVAEIPIRVRGNANQLKQVLLNLLTNARHVLADGGTVTVVLSTETGWATLRVSDTGPGVPAELRERIFEPFFSTKGDRGSGLGLAVSQTIARLHGGRLRLDEPAPQEGAAFVLELPTDPEEER